MITTSAKEDLFRLQEPVCMPKESCIIAIPKSDKFKSLYVSDDKRFGPAIAAPDRAKNMNGMSNVVKGSGMEKIRHLASCAEVNTAQMQPNIYNTDNKFEPFNFMLGKP